MIESLKYEVVELARLAVQLADLHHTLDPKDNLIEALELLSQAQIMVREFGADWGPAVKPTSPTRVITHPIKETEGIKT
jgi:hypothetical protein